MRSIFLGLFLGELVARCTPEVVNKSDYVVVIDMGSSGSRVYVYEHDGDIVRGSPGLKISPGVASFAAEPFAAAPYLEPLLTYAAARVPAALHAQTPLHVLATAGVRLLPPEAQSTLMESLREGLVLGTSGSARLSPFPLVTARVVSGASEGFYAALSVNYLSGVVNASLHPVNHLLNTTTIPSVDASSSGTAAKAGSISSKPHGALDLGGASTQMVILRPPPSSGPSPAAANSLSDVQIKPTASHTPEECSSSSSNSVLCTTAATPLQSIDVAKSSSSSAASHNDSATGATGAGPSQPLQRDDFVAHSFLGFGVDQVREWLWSQLAADTLNSKKSTSSSHSTSSIDNSTTVASDADFATASNPCGFVGHRVSWSNVTLVGTGNAEACAEAVAALLLANDCDDVSSDSDARSSKSDGSNSKGHNSGVSSASESGSEDVRSSRNDASLSSPIKQCRLGMNSEQLPASLPDNTLVAMSVYFFATDCVRVLGSILANQAAERLKLEASAEPVAVAANIKHGEATAAAAAATTATLTAIEVVEAAQNASQAMGAAWPTPSVHEIASATSGFCQSAWSDVKALADADAHDWTWPHQMPHRCFEAVLVAQLLRHGVQVPLHARQVQFAVALRGMEVEWTLGLALSVFAGATGD